MLCSIASRLLQVSANTPQDTASCAQYAPYCLQKYASSADTALQLIVTDYDSALPRARSGAALAVKACASHFGGDMLMTALHFLLEHGLADMAEVQDLKATVSEQMMQAGKS